MPRLLIKILIGCLVLGVVLVVIAWAVLSYFTQSYAKKTEEAKQRLVAQGAPMTLEEILPEPVSDDRNAVVLFDKAAVYSDEHEEALSKPLDRMDELTDDDDRPWIDYSEEQIEELKALFTEPVLAEYLTILDAATATDTYYIELRDKKPMERIGLLIPSIGSIMMASDFDAVRAMLAYEADDPALAQTYIRKQFHLAGLLHKMPILVIELSSAAVAKDGLRSIEQSTVLNTLTNAEIEGLLDSVVLPNYQADFICTMDAERLGFGEAILDVMEEEPAGLADLAESENLGRVLQSPLGKAFIQREKAHYYNAVAEIRSYYLKSDENDYAKLKEMENAVFLQARTGYYIVTAIILPSYSSIYDNLVAVDVKTSITRTALSLLQYHNDNGAYPESLDALIPECLDAVPIDPFTGEPLVYRKVDDGFQLYSFGPNQIDDGGYEDPLARTDYDIAWQGRGAVPVEAP